MKKITYQITLSDDAYIECINKLVKFILFPDKGDMVFKVEELSKEENPRPVIVNDIKYSSYEDYLESRKGE